VSEGLPPELVAALLDDMGSSPPIASLSWVSAQPKSERRAVALAVQRTLVDQPWDPLGAGFDSSHTQTAALRDVLDSLVDEGGWTRNDAIAALDAVADRGKLYESASPALLFAVRVANEQPSSSFDADLRIALEGALGAVGASTKLEDATRSTFDTALRALLPPVSVEDALLAPLDCGDSWGPRVRQALRHAGVTEAEGSVLTNLASFNPKKPGRWIDDVVPDLSERDECQRVVRVLLEMTPKTPSSIGGLTAQNAGILAAAATLAGHAKYDWAAMALVDVASWGLTWHLGQATSAGTAKAAIVALGLLGSDAAVVSLDRLGMRFGNRKAVRQQIDDALARASSFPDRQPGQGVDRSVPDLGLDPRSRRRTVAIGDHTAVLTFDGLQPALRWRDAEGRERRSVPRTLGPSHAESIATARRLLRELNDVAAVQIAELELALVSQRTWRVADWIATFGTHPVLGALAERMIWSVDGLASFIPPPIPSISPDREIRLWHPLLSDEHESGEWRGRLLEIALQQPVRQVFREIYDPTVAWLDHLSEPLFVAKRLEAVMRSRSWRVGALGGWEGGERALASRSFPDGQTEMVLAITGADREHQGLRAGPTYCEISDVRFERAGAKIDPHEVAAVFFSEGVRDLDLFANVAAVGARPPTELEDPVALAFWSAAAFEPLNPSGEIRRDIVSRLLPGWPFSECAEVSDRYLVIRADRVSRVHLGTGQVVVGDTPLLQGVPAVPKRSQIPLPIDDRRLRQIVDAAAVLALGKGTEVR
jgi:hypothetical protein